MAVTDIKISLENLQIPNHLYEELDVKRGLRNKDGSGVLAGLTRISSVLGSKKTDQGTVPCDGQLRYRGINIDELIEQLGSESRYKFERASFLLLMGRLPSQDEAEWFCQEIAKRRTLSLSLLDNAIKALKSPNIMNKLETVISALYIEDTDPDSLDPQENFVKSLDLIAKFPAIVAYAYLAFYKENARYVAAPEHLSQAEAFLYMLREGTEASALEVGILDLCLVLHAEHGGGNNSSFTTHVCTSSGTDIYSSTVASIASLKGPLHGSANKMVMDMMADIKANMTDYADETQLKGYLYKILNKEVHDKSGKIYGLGHAVYTQSDPRATVLKGKASQLAKEKGRDKEYQLYLNIEAIGPQMFNDYKGSTKVIAPNVDFFSGFVYDCLGIPEEVYTPMFAMARISGWCAHRIEEIVSGKRIIRPGYKHVDA